MTLYEIVCGESTTENNLGMVSQRLGPGGSCQESLASAWAIGPAAASAIAVTHGADVRRRKARPEDAVPAKADRGKADSSDNEVKKRTEGHQCRHGGRTDGCRFGCKFGRFGFGCRYASQVLLSPVANSVHAGRHPSNFVVRQARHP